MKKKPEPTQPIYTVPSEMHQQMVDERDKKIELLKDTISRLNGSLEKCSTSQSQPAREGWNWIPWVLLIAFSGLNVIFISLALHNLHHPACIILPPRRERDIYTFDDIQDINKKWVKTENERDHWLRNCRATWKALDCDLMLKYSPGGKGSIKEACKVLDQ